MPDPRILVRAAVPADRERYLDVVETVAAEGRWIGHELPLDRDALGRRWLNALANEAELRLVVGTGGEMVGVLSAEEYHGVVSFGMMLLPDWRGQGLGGRLLEELTAWARSRDAHKLTLQVWPHNTAAIRLYERHGFEVEGRLRRHWRRRSGELWDALVMGLLLHGDGQAARAPARAVSRTAGRRTYSGA